MKTWRTPLGLGLAALLLMPIPWFKRTERSRSWGGISRVVVGRFLARPVNAPDLFHVDFKNFLYRIYPTPPADTGMSHKPLIATPLALPVVNGNYSQRVDGTPIEFQIYHLQGVLAPRAPGGKAVLTFGILFSGRRSRTCAGVVQEYAWQQGKLALLNQITYNCRGGGSAEFLATRQRLRINSAHYAMGDRLCCPSLNDRVDFVLDGLDAHATHIRLAQ